MKSWPFLFQRIKFKNWIVNLSKVHVPIDELIQFDHLNQWVQGMPCTHL
jgi:hypothetical protein